MKENYLPFDKEPLSYDAYERIAGSAREKAGLCERKMIEMKTTSNKKKIVKRAVIIAAAALLMMPVAAGAYAIKGGSLDIFGKFHAGDTSSFQHDLESTLQTVSNEDITIAIDGIIADDFDCDINVSVYANSEKGKEIIAMLNDPSLTKEMYYFQQLKLEHEGIDLSDDEELEDCPWYTNDFWTGSQQYPDMNSDTEYHTKEQVNMMAVDRSNPFKLTELYTGLSMEFDVSPYLESYRLYADEGAEDICHYVSISPLGVRIMGTPEDLSPMSMYNHLGFNDDNAEIYVNYADGTSEKLDCHFGSTGDSGDTWKYMGETFTDFKQLVQKWNSEEGIPEFINAKDAVSVTINGVEYKKS